MSLPIEEWAKRAKEGDPWVIIRTKRELQMTGNYPPIPQGKRIACSRSVAMMLINDGDAEVDGTFVLPYTAPAYIHDPVWQLLTKWERQLRAIAAQQRGRNET